MGWNNAISVSSHDSTIDLQNASQSDSAFYFVHSYRVDYTSELTDWTHTVTRYDDEVFISAIKHRNIYATQFHPEKSGAAGLKLLKGWLSDSTPSDKVSCDIVDVRSMDPYTLTAQTGLMKRIIACLDVRANDDGDLVVTKGDQYDVRESNIPTSDVGTAVGPKGEVRNLGKPVDLARRYYVEGADEITFLNITSFRACPLHDQPMLTVLQKAAETVFVPFCVGGGIRDTVDPDGTKRSALEVATAYFRAGADKVSIGGDAVMATELVLSGKIVTETSIQAISRVYGSQAVVVSVDPKRVYVSHPQDAPIQHQPSVVDLAAPLETIGSNTSRMELESDFGPNGERFCWYQCTVKGGREARPVDVVQLTTTVASLGAGEILLNSVDKDGSKSGFDLRLVQLVKRHVSIPVIASSGAGRPEHFHQLFTNTHVEAGLAAGIFHRNEVPLQRVKSYLTENQVLVRPPSEIPPA